MLGIGSYLFGYTYAPIILNSKQIDSYARSGTISDPHADAMVNYLKNLFIIAGLVKAKGNLIWTACEAGKAVEGEKSIALSMYQFLSCSNPEVNVLMNTDYTPNGATNANPTSCHKITFDNKISQHIGFRGWTVANKLSPDARTAMGDIILQKQWKAIEFTGNINKLLNR